MKIALTVTLAAVNKAQVGSYRGGQVAVNAKKIAVYVLVVFVLYVIITDPAKAADYVQIGFQGISDAAKAVGDFFTWLADGAE
ncbi:hypothetical protein ABZT34_13005 [Streptomyces sp. NPDC005329]|uniref:hypothetical protein n=1 Tax=Streptomyces sp. NPDC005329 TaxID=3157034 RepID=UPI0033BAD05B